MFPNQRRSNGLFPKGSELKKTVRTEQIVDQFLAGKSGTEIAANLDVSEGTVYQATRQVLDAKKAEIKDKMEDHLAKQLLRIEKMIEVLWEKVINEKSLTTVDRVIKLMQEEAKLLGLYAAPKIIQAEDKPTATPEERQSRIQELLQVAKEREASTGATTNQTLN